ncbi:tyrosine protein phosphatase [Clostridia bacterium]|nr:tyrosine protein phosphatase [Clostridia bacterium]
MPQTPRLQFIDIHCHLLPGIDDGSRDWDMTEVMLRQAWDNGITKIIATSHADPARREFPLLKYTETLDKANALSRQKELGVELLPGCEIMYAEGITERLLGEQRIPCLAGTRHVLVEFYPDVRYDTILAALIHLANAGYAAILAHIERYECLYKRYDRIAELRAADAKLQVNCNTIIKPAGFFAKRYIDRLLSDNLIDCLATDAHSSDVRRINMKEAYDVIIKSYKDGERLFQAEGLKL